MNENLLAILLITLYFSPVFYQFIIVLKESRKGNRVPLKKLLKFVKYSFLVLSLLVVGFGIISHTNYFNYEKPLTYDKFDQITFENFRGLEFFKKSLYGNEHFAYVVTTIDSEIDKNKVTVNSLFHPSRSYVYNTYTNSKELLTHEKYHIKITELYTRKAKKKLSELNSFSINKIEGILKQTKQEERAFQKSYDYDTFHSYVLSEQKKYEKDIDSLLNLLNEFENPTITIYDKN